MVDMVDMVDSWKGGRHGRHGRHYYSGDKIMDLKQLQEELKKSNPLTNLPEKERLWLIDYAKLRACFYKYHDQFVDQGYRFPGEVYDPFFEDKYEIAAWKTSHRPGVHPVNMYLEMIKDELDHLGVDWKKEQDYKVDYIVCDYSPSEGCTDCKFIKECDLKL